MSENYDFSSVRVMLVDESEFLARVLKTILHCIGIRDVHIFTDARQALLELANSPPDLMFIDYSPVQAVNAMKMVRALRRHAHAARFCPVVIMSSMPDSALVRRARNAGADYTLAKPYSVSAVHRILVALRNLPRHFVEVGDYLGPDRRRKQRTIAHGERRGSGDEDGGSLAA